MKTIEMKNIEIKNTVNLTEEELQTTNGGILPLVIHGSFILLQAGMAAGIYEQEKKYRKK
ncbi:class IIb bacteriocin, lactobin A/cerein 7B family [Bacillus toyonensis]|uniref:class IIb bacteriocin, lactobin A/cerein 7B family n=1 Tax=Bacillus toyonensis TaxID=155322 RepID=UPI001C0B8CC3|nr:class IIb bacteriocin, lactobin A/cerein 7B family [Bacillus toyonensis]MBU4643024.1 class IIb bacteriocin, lactobin A/cerein 7B family [Bacillus toyonensis]